MEKVIQVFDCAEGVIKPEILFYYGACAVLITIFVNWALAMLLVILKPFTCAGCLGILIAFLRPDLVQAFLHEEHMMLIGDKLKRVCHGLLGLVLYIGGQLRTRLS